MSSPQHSPVVVEAGEAVGEVLTLTLTVEILEEEIDMAEQENKPTEIDVDMILKVIGGLVVVGFVGWLVVKLFWWIVAAGVIGGAVWYLNKDEKIAEKEEN